MSETNCGIKVLVRDAVDPKDRARGLKICRSAVLETLEGKELDSFITAFGLSRTMVVHGALAIGDLIRILGSCGMGAHLEGLGFLAPVVSGKFDPKDPNWRDKIEIGYHIRLEKSLQRRIAKDAHFYTTPMQPANPILKRIQRTTDLPEFAGELAAGENFLIKGSRMKFDRKNPQEGVFFENIGRCTQRFRDDTARPDAGMIMCKVPNGVETGKTYRLVVRAKMYRCKTVHEAVFGSTVTITA